MLSSNTSVVKVAALYSLNARATSSLESDISWYAISCSVICTCLANQVLVTLSRCLSRYFSLIFGLTPSILLSLIYFCLICYLVLNKISTFDFY